jgi:hypothetical protein
MIAEMEMDEGGVGGDVMADPLDAFAHAGVEQRGGVFLVAEVKCAEAKMVGEKHTINPKS